MALDIYWQESGAKVVIGNITVDNAFENLLSMYEQHFGINIDPYGSNKLYVSQWEQLTAFASRIGFDSEKLNIIQARFSTNASDGFLVLEGD